MTRLSLSQGCNFRLSIGPYWQRMKHIWDSLRSVFSTFQLNKPKCTDIWYEKVPYGELIWSPLKSTLVDRQFLEKKWKFLAIFFLKNMSSFLAIFDSQMAIFRRVRYILLKLNMFARICLPLRYFKLIVYLINAYTFKSCPMPYQMVDETIFLTIINNVTTSQPAYLPFSKVAKWLLCWKKAL